VTDPPIALIFTTTKGKIMKSLVYLITSRLGNGRLAKFSRLRYRFWTATLSVTLVFSVTTVGTYGQSSCLSNCEKTLLICMQQAGGDPVAEDLCQSQYEDCSSGCNGNLQQREGKTVGRFPENIQPPCRLERRQLLLDPEQTGLGAAMR